MLQHKAHARFPPPICYGARVRLSTLACKLTPAQAAGAVKPVHMDSGQNSKVLFSGNEYSSE